MANFYAKIINHYRFEYHIIFLASFVKINDEDQISDEIEFFINWILVKI